MRTIIALLILTLAWSVSAGIYKWVDEEGNVHYGDEPPSGDAKEVSRELPGLSTYSPPPLPDLPPPARPEPEAPYYKAVTLISPEEGATLRSNPGEVTLFVAVQPEMRDEDYLKVEMDGRLLPGEYRTTVIRLSNVDRGEHKVAVLLYDNRGELLLKSPLRTFYLHRAFIRPQAR